MLDREQCQSILAEILRRCGSLHPAVRKPLVDEAQGNQADPSICLRSATSLFRSNLTA